MGNDGFFRRWSRLKSHGDAGRGEAGPQAAGNPRAQPLAPAHAASAGAGGSMQRADELQALDLPPVAQTAPHPPFAPPLPDAAPRRVPTIEDVAALGPQSDFSAFVSQGVDKTVQRLAMKKLFSDPHFSILDGLDVYIDDYSKADPIPAAMLASLEHAKSVFARLLDDETAAPAAGNTPPTDAKPEGPAASDVPPDAGKLEARAASDAAPPNGRPEGPAASDAPPDPGKPEGLAASDARPDTGEPEGPAASGSGDDEGEGRKPDGPQPPDQTNA
jgi:hypothetical protein